MIACNSIWHLITDFSKVGLVIEETCVTWVNALGWQARFLLKHSSLILLYFGNIPLQPHQVLLILLRCLHLFLLIWCHSNFWLEKPLREPRISFLLINLVIMSISAWGLMIWCTFLSILGLLRWNLVVDSMKYTFHIFARREVFIFIELFDHHLVVKTYELCIVLSDSILLLVPFLKASLHFFLFRGDLRKLLAPVVNMSKSLVETVNLFPYQVSFTLLILSLNVKATAFPTTLK